MKQLVARTSEQLTACKDLILRLRPDLNENNYLNLLRNMMEEESFKLVYIPNDGGVNAAAFIGYRTMYLLQQGWVMYIDGQYTGYFGEVDHLIPWQIDHLNVWRPVAEKSCRSSFKIS